MDTVTVRYRRKDGTRKCTYVCRVHRERPQDCAAKPIDATAVDGPVIENLATFLGDVALWRDRLVQGREAERSKLGGEVQRAADALADETRRLATRTAEWERQLDAGDPARADVALGAVLRCRTDHEKAERRHAAARDALAAVLGEATTEPTDALLDFYGALQGALAGRVADARGDVKRLNAAMRDYFEAVELRAVATGVEVRPLLSAQASARILHQLEHWPHRAVYMAIPEHAAPANAAAQKRTSVPLTEPDGAMPLVAEPADPPAIVTGAPPVRAILAPAVNARAPS